MIGNIKSICDVIESEIQYDLSSFKELVEGIEKSEEHGIEFDEPGQSANLEEALDEL